MSYEMPILDLTLEAAEDLTASQYHLIVVDNTGKAALAGADEAAVGVVQNEPDAGEGASVRVQGVTKVVAGAAVTAGAKVSADLNGAGVTAVAGHVVGIALTEASGAGAIFSVLLTHEG